MTRAKRFSNATSVAKELNAYYASVILDDQVAYEKAIDDFYENEQYESLFGKSSRVGWLMDNKGLSFLEAVKQVAKEEKQWEDETFAWLHDPKNKDSEIYSDVYKDYYGVRPRW